MTSIDDSISPIVWHWEKILTMCCALLEISCSRNEFLITTTYRCKIGVLCEISTNSTVHMHLKSFMQVSHCSKRTTVYCYTGTFCCNDWFTQNRSIIIWAHCISTCTMVLAFYTEKEIAVMHVTKSGIVTTARYSPDEQLNVSPFNFVCKWPQTS